MRELKIIFFSLSLLCISPLPAEAVPKLPPTNSGEKTYFRDADSAEILLVPDEWKISKSKHDIFVNNLTREATSTYTLILEPNPDATSLKELRQRYPQRNVRYLELETVELIDVHDLIENKISGISVYASRFDQDSQTFRLTMSVDPHRYEPDLSRLLTIISFPRPQLKYRYSIRAVLPPTSLKVRIEIKKLVKKLQETLDLRTNQFSYSLIEKRLESISFGNYIQIKSTSTSDQKDLIMKLIKQKIIDLLFVSEMSNPENEEESPTLELTFRQEIKELGHEISLDISDSQKVYTHSISEQESNILTIPTNSLHPNLKYFCDPWGKYDKATDGCVTVCIPFSEQWNRKTNSCEPYPFIEGEK